MVCVDSIIMEHLLKCTQRYSSLKLRAGGEGWQAICVCSRALCDGRARNKDNDEVIHNPTTLLGPTAKR